MSVRNMNSAPSGNNGDKDSMPDVNSREYKINQYYQARIEEAKAKAEANNTEKNIEADSIKAETPEVNVNRQGYIDWRKEKSESEKAQALEAQRLAREKYYKEQHDLREEQYNHEADTPKDAERNENDRKIELRHQFDQVKLEADTFLKMQAGLGLMNEKEIREYKDNLNKQEKNALEYMRDGGEGSLVPMENLMKRSLDQISDFEAKIQATPEYQEMIRKKMLARKGLDAIKERRGNDADLGVNDFRFKEKVYKMQANLAEREFLSKAFSAEDKKNTNEALDAATEKFNKLDEEAIKLTRELKAGGRKLTFEDYQKIDAAWGASAAAEAKMNEIKNVDKKEIAFDFAQNQYKKIQKGEQMSGVEGSFLSKFNVLTGEDTIDKFEPTVKDKLGKAAAMITETMDSVDNGKTDTKTEGGVENDSKQTVELPPAIIPGEGIKKGNQLINPGTGENNPKDDSKNPEDGSKDSEKDKKKGFIAGVVEKIKKHGEGIRRFMMAAGIGALVAFAAYGGYKLGANNTAVEKSMDKDNNGDTDGNVEKALAEHDASGETDGSENEKLNESVSYNVIVDGVEKTVELSDEVDTSAPDFTNPNRHLNDFGYMDMSKLKEMKEQGASEEAMGFEAMNMLNEALRNPHILANTGANLGVFGDIDSYEDVNEITNMIQNGDDESRAAIRHEVNEALAEFWNGATPKIGTLKAGTPYESCFATQVGGDGNFQINIARDMNGVVHDHDVFYLYGEKDGQDIFNKNELGGIKEKMMKKLGVIKATDNADVRMAKMESGHCIVLEDCAGQDGYVLDVKDPEILYFNQKKTNVNVTSVITSKNTEVKNKEPGQKSETPPSTPKNETPPSTPKENPKTPENNVSDGKTNTASTDGNQQKMGKVEADKAIYEFGDENHDATKQLPGSEIEDKAVFDQMVREAAKQNLTPNSYVTTQDNSQGVVHQEGVATEKQTNAENRSILPEEKPVERQDIQGSHSEDKTFSDNDLGNIAKEAKADNTFAHESGQTTTVDTTSSSEQ